MGHRKPGEGGKLNMVSLCFYSFLFLCCLSIGYQIVLKNVVVDLLHIKNDFVAKTISSLDGSLYDPEPVDINWVERYPFPDEAAYVQIELESEEETGDEQNLGALGKFIEQMEKYSSKYLMIRDDMDQLANEFNKVMGMRLIDKNTNGKIIFLDDGRIAREQSLLECRDLSANVISLCRWLETRQTDFVYVQSPGSVDKYHDHIPPGYEEHSNENVDGFLKDLSENDVPVLDLREKMNDQRMDYRESFFLTDHHWRPEVGLWAAGMIAEWLNENNNYSIDLLLFDPDQYIMKTYKNCFMGGYGREITKAFAAPEDVELLLPAFQTNFSFSIPSLGIDRGGVFSETMINWNQWPSYNAYFYGINALTEIKNNRVGTEGKKILIISDSMQEVVTPYLACGVNKVSSIDLRMFTGSVEAYIEEFCPDAVVIMYTPAILGTKAHKKCFTFR